MGLFTKKKRGPGTKQSEVSDWLRKIERAVKVRERWAEQFRVKLANEYWEGRQRPQDAPADEWITVNMIYSLLQAELPTLYSTDPYFYVKLKKSYDPDPEAIAVFEQRGEIRQAMLNYLKGELDLKPKARLAILDAFFEYGVAKVHLGAELRENDKAGELINDDAGLPLFDEDTGQAMVEPELIPANQRYELDRVNPGDFVVDEDASPLGYGWCGQRLVRPLKEAKEDKAYSAAARKLLKPTALSQELKEREEAKKGGGLASSDRKAEEPDLVVLWEVYDNENEQMFVVAEGLEEKYLSEPKGYPPGFDGDPFVTLRYTPRRDSWYPLPPVSQWLDSQREYCEARSKIMVHRRRFNRKYVLYQQAFDDAEAAASKLETGGDGTVLIAQANPGWDPVSPINDAPIDSNTHTELAYLRGDFDSLAVGANQRGATAGVDSATEAGILEQRARTREGDKLGLVADFVKDIGRKTDQQVQAHITEDQAVKVTGPQGEFWQVVRVDDYEEIKGEYEYSVNVGASTPQLPEIERAQWNAFLGVIANAPQLMLSRALLEHQAKLHNIDDEAMVDELFALGQKIAGGQVATPGQQGPQAGTPSPGTAAASATGGAAAGINNIRGGEQ